MYYPSSLEDFFSKLIIQEAQRFETDERWDNALILWRKGADMMEDERFLIGMAGCLSRLGRYAEAKRLLARYNAEHGWTPVELPERLS